MGACPAPHGRTGGPRRPPARRSSKRRAAIVDRDGWEKLTIRRLAAELGVGATTLYHHVRDKEDLLIQLLDYYADQLPRPDLPADPRERIIAAATVMHDSLAAWPRAVEVLTADDLVGRSALWMVDDHGRRRIGLRVRPEQAVDLYREHLVLHGRRDPGARDRGRRRAADERPVTAMRCTARWMRRASPRWRRSGSSWAKLAARDTYGSGLRAFVDGLLAQESK